MPTDPRPDLTQEATRVAREAVDALEAFAHAATNLPADVARLALDVVEAAADKAKEVVNAATRKK